jgi:hypothetical protein
MQAMLKIDRQPQLSLSRENYTVYVHSTLSPFSAISLQLTRFLVGLFVIVVESSS